MKEIRTKRIKFRELELSDVDNLQMIFSDSIAMKFYPSTKSVSATLEWINWNIESYRENGFGLWALLDKVTGEFLGQCGLILQRDVDGVDEIEIGYLLVRKYWGNGLATEAASACRNYAFSELGCERVISLINPKNIPSISVAERIGLVLVKKIQRWETTTSVYMQSSTSYNKSIVTDSPINALL